MKKKLILTFFAMLLVFITLSTSNAGSYGEFKAIGAGELWGDNYVATAFNANAGEVYFLSGGTLEYPSTVGFCGLSSYYAMGNLLGIGYTNVNNVYTTGWSDFYVWLCIKSSGSSGNFYASAMHGAYNQSSNIMSMQNAEDYPEELITRLKEAFKSIPTNE